MRSTRDCSRCLLSIRRLCRVVVATFVLSCLVDGFAQFHGGFGNVLDAGLDLVGVVGFQFVFQRGNGQFDRFDGGRVDLVGMLFQRLLGRVDQRFRLVLRFDQLATGLVRLGILFRVFDHLFNVRIRQTA